MKHLPVVFTLAGGLVYAGVLWADDAQKTAPALPQYTFTLTPQDVAVIAAGLNELPKRIADPMIEKLRGQAQAQEKRAAEAAARSGKPTDANGNAPLAKGGRK